MISVSFRARFKRAARRIFLRCPVFAYHFFFFSESILEKCDEKKEKFSTFSIQKRCMQAGTAGQPRHPRRRLFILDKPLFRRGRWYSPIWQPNPDVEEARTPSELRSPIANENGARRKRVIGFPVFSYRHNMTMTMTLRQ